MADGTISRSVVSGRVLFGERLRDALIRNIEKDLGSLALPKIPVDPCPCTVVEYFPDSDVSGYTDPRQHAVSLAIHVIAGGEDGNTDDEPRIPQPGDIVARRDGTPGQDGGIEK